LKDGDLLVRRSAVNLLVRMKANSAIEPMSQMLDTADVCVEVPCALASFREARAVLPLLGSLTSPRKDIRECSARALGRLGDTRAVDPLINCLARKEESDSVRYAVVEALVSIGDTKAVEPLINCLERKEDSDSFRIAVVKALASIKDARAVTPLIRCLERTDDSDSFRIAVVEALATIGDTSAVEPLINRLERKDDSVSFRVAVVEALASIKDARAVEPLIRCLERTEASDIFRSAVAKALATIGDTRAVEPLIRCFEHKDDAGRFLVTVIDALCRFVDTRAIAIEPLICCLHKESIDYRVAAAMALGQYGDVRAVAPLIELLNQLMEKPDVSDWSRRRDRSDKLLFIAVIRALGKLGNKLAIAPLVQILLNRTKYIEPYFNSYDGMDRAMSTKACKVVARKLCMILEASHLAIWDIWDVECLSTGDAIIQLIEVLRRYATPADWMLEPPLP
jgi:HEAT repeat protein